MVTAIKGNDTSTFGGNIDVPQIITDAPGFSAYQSSGQSISTSTLTTLVFDIEEYDLTSDFDTSTYKFTPSVEGYYLFTGFVRINMTDAQLISVRLNKNGSRVRNVIEDGTGKSGNIGFSFATVEYANGTTDEFSLALLHTSGVTETTTGGATYTSFQAHLVRAV